MADIAIDLGLILAIIGALTLSMLTNIHLWWTKRVLLRRHKEAAAEYREWGEGLKADLTGKVADMSGIRNHMVAKIGDTTAQIQHMEAKLPDFGLLTDELNGIKAHMAAFDVRMKENLERDPIQDVKDAMKDHFDDLKTTLPEYMAQVQQAFEARKAQAIQKYLEEQGMDETQIEAAMSDGTAYSPQVMVAALGKEFLEWDPGKKWHKDNVIGSALLRMAKMKGAEMLGAYQQAQEGAEEHAAGKKKSGFPDMGV